MLKGKGGGGKRRAGASAPSKAKGREGQCARHWPLKRQGEGKRRTQTIAIMKGKATGRCKRGSST